MASRLLRDADEFLINAFCVGRWLYEADHKNHRLIITATHRSVAEQQALYAQGRTKPGAIVTQVDGVTQKSNHNYLPSRAIDFAIVNRETGAITWADAEYKVAGPYFVSQGLVWGGNWVSFKDYPHVELKEAP